MRTEYLVTISKNFIFGKTNNSFKNLLMACDRIELTDTDILFLNHKFNYSLETNDNSEIDVIIHHFSFELADDSNCEVYIKLQDCIESILKQYCASYETIWDDLSCYFAEQSYPILHKTENLMRYLITKFMYVNVGSKWQTENLPSSINKAPSVKRSSSNSGIVYTLDFIELSDVLFKEYTSNSNWKYLKSKRTELSFNDVKGYIPFSNWERYFKDIVEMDGDVLKQKWSDLYELRCAIAHNRRIRQSDFEKIKSLSKEVELCLRKAISGLNNLVIPDDEKEKIAETVAMIRNETLGTFISAFLKLERLLEERYEKCEETEEFSVAEKPFFSPKAISYALKENGVIDDGTYKTIQQIIYYRNRVVHGQMEGITEEKLNNILQQTLGVHDILSKRRDANDSK